MKLATLGWVMVLAAGCGSPEGATVRPLDMTTSTFPFDGGVPHGPPPSFGPTVTSPVPPVPLSGGTLRVLDDGKTAVATDPDRDNVYIADLTGPTLLSTVALNAGDEPGRIVEDAAGHVQVLARRGGAVIAIDPATGTILDRRAVCPAPRGIAYDAAADQLDIACAGGELVTLPAAGGAATRTLKLERDLRDVVVVGSQLWVSTFRSAQVIVVDANGTIGARLSLPSSFVLSSMSPSVAWRMLALANGQIGIVHQESVTGPVQTSPGGYGGGGGVGCGGIVQSAMTVLDGSTSQVVGTTLLNQAVLPADFAVDANGNVSVLSAGNSHTLGFPQVVTFSMSSIVNSGAPSPTGNTGSMAVGNCLFANGPTTDGEAIAVAYDGASRLWIQTREPAMLVSPAFNLKISLSTDSRADTGWAIFHSNSGGNIACASCHPEGGEDGHIWQFADLGPRRTQSLRGDVGPTAPFHWNGEFPDFGALLGNVYVGRMSGPKLQPDQEQALLGWVDTIPLLPQSPPADPAAVARGQSLFQDATHVGCTTCHAGTELTDNATVDVGTGGLFQVPRLVGVGWRAPFMHDGCAQTLTDRFGSCGGTQHGTTSQLTAAQISDLVAYLNTL